MDPAGEEQPRELEVGHVHQLELGAGEPGEEVAREHRLAPPAQGTAKKYW